MSRGEYLLRDCNAGVASFRAYGIVQSVGSHTGGTRVGSGVRFLGKAHTGRWVVIFDKSEKPCFRPFRATEAFSRFALPAREACERKLKLSWVSVET